MESNSKSVNSHIKTQKDLNDLLEGYGIETYLWGNKGYKNRESLFKEIQNNLTEIFIEDGQRIVRKLRTASINIYYDLPTTNGKLISLRLREVAKIRKDQNDEYISSNIIKRHFHTSIGTKLIIDQEVREGALYALGKINITPANELYNYRSYTQKIFSNSYPGLMTIYEAHKYDLKINSSQFLVNGYCYGSKKSITILEWVID